MNPMKVGLLGFGVVGSGTYAVLTRNAEEISRRAGRQIVVSKVATRTPAKAVAVFGDKVPVSTDMAGLVADPEVDIVVELIGGTTLARELVLTAIENGKHVVTANKALLALHGNEIFALASKKGVMVAFEAAVAGGIPIIKAIREGLTANRIQWLAGIINGTTNFILSEMREHGLPYETVLAQAQQLGYAEADPEGDVKGIDAAHKLTLMASLAFGIPIQFSKAYIEGITDLDPQDIVYAERLGYRIKLLGITRRRDQGIELRVHPALVPTKRLIANVEGAMNAVSSMVMRWATRCTMVLARGPKPRPRQWWPI
jgi:homoserine dehydrogenase